MQLRNKRGFTEIKNKLITDYNKRKEENKKKKIFKQKKDFSIFQIYDRF